MGEDLPVISLPTESTKINLPAPGAAKPAEPPKAAPAKAPAPAPKPAVRPPVVSVPTPARPMAAAPAPAADAGEDDPEKLLREYADRQKTKIIRLEQQVVETKKIVADRDSLRTRVEALEKELLAARRQIEAAAKQDEVIKDLQGKIDAAILSNGILTDDKEKLKKGLAQQTENLKKTEDRAAAAEKSLAEAQRALARETEARQVSEGKIAAALHALSASAGHGSAPADKRSSTAVEAKAPAPVAEKHAAAHAAGPKPAVAPVKK